jgi:hypothetical protein
MERQMDYLDGAGLAESQNHDDVHFGSAVGDS